MKTANAYYLIVDLEATCSDDGAVPRDEMETVEIGAVMQSARTFEIEAEFQTFVRPVRHPELTGFCVNLTSITPVDVASAPLFPQAFGAMMEWANAFGDPLFCSWGEYDRAQIMQDCEFHGVAYPFRSGHLNLKTAFSDAIGRKKKFGVTGAIRHLGMEFEGRHHRGLDDARNIARIVQRVSLGTSLL